ncbi:MAG TPA: MerR family transcriptional regulator [Rhizomicrobium sp.]|jgi:DNA-binding transcriptional MerR regulator|nr:MerR family transcriptional regulator [Rhizomicrobium sp.]
MLASPSANVGAKSPEAFRTISEVSTELDVPQHVLRFWEGRFAQIKPVKRAGGRRYYRPEDIDLLRGIRALLYLEGFTIKGAQKILRDRGLRYVSELGRGEGDSERPTSRKLSEFIAVPEEPQFARAALSVLGAPDESGTDAPAEIELAAQEREKLSGLLEELLQLRVRLRDTRSRSRA